jgi:katanin p60 ATPase-containing subunit A1
LSFLYVFLFFSGQIVFLAATNCPWDLDTAMRRRLEKRIFIPLPDYSARVELIQLLIKSITVSEDFELEQLAEMTEGYSGSDLQVAMREASMMPMRRLLDLFSPQQILEMKTNGNISVPRVTMNDFILAVQNTRPSVAANSIGRFKNWEEEFGNK